MLPPVVPPTTPREVVHLIFGDEHIDCSVASYEKRPLVLRCSCGVEATLTNTQAKQVGTTLRELRAALKSAPRIFRSGDDE